MNEDSGDRLRPNAGEGRQSEDVPADSVPSGLQLASGYETLAADASDGRPGGVDLRDGGSEPPRDADDGARARDAREGKVYLVGAGPGDPGLLTRRAWRLVESADAVLHDSLVNGSVLDRLPASVDVVDVGKRPPDRTSQAEINDLLVERSSEGEAVVRLKGGDPNVFGRGGEEAQHLASADVPFETVPGVSSAIGAPGVAGIPLTHRKRASSLTVITGHETPDKDESALDWAALADTVVSGGTLVVLMGVRRLPENVAALRDHGVPAETPVAMVQKATWAAEQTVTGTLDTIVAESEAADVEPPAVTVVGDVVGVRDQTDDCRDR